MLSGWKNGLGAIHYCGSGVFCHLLVDIKQYPKDANFIMNLILKVLMPEQRQLGSVLHLQVNPL